MSMFALSGYLKSKNSDQTKNGHQFIVLEVGYEPLNSKPVIHEIKVFHRDCVAAFDEISVGEHIMLRGSLAASTSTNSEKARHFTNLVADSVEVL